ncbi:MAG: hypothetical protein DMF79_08720, partial [Acidobacteria bacterium]
MRIALMPAKVETAESVAHLRPGGAVDADQAGLTRVQPATLDPVEDGRRIDGLQQRPGVASRGQVAEQVLVERLARRDGLALDRGHPGARGPSGPLEHHLHPEPLPRGDGQLRGRGVPARTRHPEAVPAGRHIGEAHDRAARRDRPARPEARDPAQLRDEVGPGRARGQRNVDLDLGGVHA